MKTTLIPIDIYETELAIHIGTYKELQAILSTEYNEEIEDIESTQATYCGIFRISGLKRQVILIHKDFLSISLLVHEFFHAVVDLFRFIGIKLSPESEESFAYLQDFLLKRTLYTLKEQKIKVKYE